MNGNQTALAWQPSVLDLNSIPGAFAEQEGFSRPNWKLIRQFIREQISEGSHGEAWAEAARQWLLRLQSDLGGKYQVRRSREFLLLSELDAAASQQLLGFAESTLDSINGVLKAAAWRWDQGKHVLLLFSELDDYYQYLAFYSREGVQPASGGCLIHKDYVHIAMPYGHGGALRQVLAHELTHNSVVHLPLPLWLNEGLAVLFERTVSHSRRPFLDGELRDRHLAFWHAENIQKFWAGVSFQEPGDSNELSYSLAEILVNLAKSQPGDFIAFVQQAQWADGGQTAALDCLGLDLGQLMGTFLGEGNWRPYQQSPGAMLAGGP